MTPPIKKPKSFLIVSRFSPKSKYSFETNLAVRDYDDFLDDSSRYFPSDWDETDIKQGQWAEVLLRLLEEEEYNRNIKWVEGYNIGFDEGTERENISYIGPDGEVIAELLKKDKDKRPDIVILNCEHEIAYPIIEAVRELQKKKVKISSIWYRQDDTTDDEDYLSYFADITIANSKHVKKNKKNIGTYWANKVHDLNVSTEKLRNTWVELLLRPQKNSSGNWPKRTELVKHILNIGDYKTTLQTGELPPPPLPEPEVEIEVVSRKTPLKLSTNLYQGHTDLEPDEDYEFKEEDLKGPGFNHDYDVKKILKTIRDNDDPKEFRSLYEIEKWKPKLTGKVNERSDLEDAYEILYRILYNSGKFSELVMNRAGLTSLKDNLREDINNRQIDFSHLGRMFRSLNEICSDRMKKVKVLRQKNIKVALLTDNDVKEKEQALVILNVYRLGELAVGMIALNTIRDLREVDADMPVEVFTKNALIVLFRYIDLIVKNPNDIIKKNLFLKDEYKKVLSYVEGEGYSFSEHISEILKYIYVDSELFDKEHSLISGYERTPLRGKKVVTSKRKEKEEKALRTEMGESPRDVEDELDEFDDVENDPDYQEFQKMIQEYDQEILALEQEREVEPIDPKGLVVSTIRSTIKNATQIEPTKPSRGETTIVFSYDQWNPLGYNPKQTKKEKTDGTDPSLKIAKTVVELYDEVVHFEFKLLVDFLDKKIKKNTFSLSNAKNEKEGISLAFIILNHIIGGPSTKPGDRGPLSKEIRQILRKDEEVDNVDIISDNFDKYKKRDKIDIVQLGIVSRAIGAEKGALFKRSIEAEKEVLETKEQDEKKLETWALKKAVLEKKKRGEIDKSTIAGAPGKPEMVQKITDVRFYRALLELVDNAIGMILFNKMKGVPLQTDLLIKRGFQQIMDFTAQKSLWQLIKGDKKEQLKALEAIRTRIKKQYNMGYGGYRGHLFVVLDTYINLYKESKKEIDLCSGYERLGI